MNAEANQAEMSEQDFDTLLGNIGMVLEQGGTLGNMRGFSAEEMEAIYSLAYNLYTQGKYQDAEGIFKFLVVYGHLDKRFWMGLGGCRQHLGQYEQAVEAYSYLSLLDVENPYPPMHAADCYLAMGDAEKARSGFEAAIHWSGDNEEYALVRQRAEALLSSMGQSEEAAE